MLILTRKMGEGIYIGDSVFIKVMNVGNGIAKIGIDAPADIEVHREEIYQKIKESEIGRVKNG